MSTADLANQRDGRGARSGNFREFHDSRLSASENESFLMFVMRIIQHRRFTILAALILIPILTAIAIGRMTPLYTATTVLIYEPHHSNLLADLQKAIDPSAPDSSIESQIEIIKSRTIIQRVVDALGLVLKAEFNPAIANASANDPQNAGFLGKLSNKLSTTIRRVIGGGPTTNFADPSDNRVMNETVVRNMLERLKVNVVGRSSVITVGFTSEDPNLAKDIVDKIASIYIDNQLELKFQSMKRATTWLNDRLDTLRVQVNSSERAVEEFRAQAGLQEGVSSALVTEEVSKVNTGLIDAQTALASAEANLAQVRSFAKSPGSLASIPEILQSEAIRDLRQQETTALAREAELAARVGARHPDLIESRAQLARLRDRIFEEIGRVSRGVENEVRAARARVDSIRQSLENSQGRASRADAAMIRLRALEREARSDQDLLQTMLSRSKEVGQQYEIEQPDARILSDGYASPEPTFPKTKLFIAASVVIGLVIGLLLAYLAELLDQTFRSVDEIENTMGLPAVAIPRIGKSDWKVPFLDYVLLKPSSVFAETVRSLRTLLWLTDLQTRAKLVSVTSSRRGEGKTTTAISLARVAALAGERVLIIDCDLMRPMIHTAFKQANSDGGLTDLLTGRANRREVTKGDPHLANLHYIAAGSRSEKLSELLRSDNMIALLREARNEYDLVVVDTPPALVVSDSRVLATMADAVVYCVAWRSTPRSSVSAGMKTLYDVGANVLCAALTQVKFTSMRYRDRMDYEAYAAGRAQRSMQGTSGEVASARS